MKQFLELPPNSKVWIYQSNKPFSLLDKQIIETDAPLFLQQWQSHGLQMNADFKIFFNRFLVIALDESLAGASGCGIDKSVHFIKNLETKLGINFFDRLNICYTNDNAKNIYSETEKTEIKEVHFSKIESEDFLPNTRIFNNAVTTKLGLEKEWIIPISESWIQKHLPQSKTN